jgi:uncharacterized protein (TIGR03437 family)
MTGDFSMRMHAVLPLIFWCFPLTAQLQIHAVTTGAGYLPGITRPGGISIVFCTGLAGISGITEAKGAPLPTELAGVRVVVNGINAPLLAVSDMGSYQQVNFLVPNLPDFTRPPITISVVQSNKGASTKLAGNPFNGYPADFFRDPAGYGIIEHAADHSLVTSQNPARRGEIVIAYATGMGAVEPPVANEVAAPQQPPSPLILYPGEPGGIRVFLCQPGAQCAPTEAAFNTPSLFAGLSPGAPGLYQIKFQIPDTAPTGPVELGVIRTYCYDAPCTIQSPFQQNFVSESVKIAIQ